MASMVAMLTALMPMAQAFAQGSPLVTGTTLTNAPNLTPGARDAAGLLGIGPKVDRLIALRQARTNPDTISDEELALKVDVLEKIMTASLEVRMVSDRIDKELTWAFVSQGGLEAKRQRNLNYLFIANFMQGGTLGVLSGPAFLSGEPKTGTELLLLASSIGLGLSTLSLLLSRSGTRKIDGETTVLADVFHLAQPPQEYQYPLVLKFLNSVPPRPGCTQTRIDALMTRWKQGHYLHSTSEHQLQRVAALQPAMDKQRENIGLISSRIRLLFDTQNSVQELDTELLELLRAADTN